LKTDFIVTKGVRFEKNANRMDIKNKAHKQMIGVFTIFFLLAIIITAPISSALGCVSVPMCKILT